MIDIFILYKKAYVLMTYAFHCVVVGSRHIYIYFLNFLQILIWDFHLISFNDEHKGKYTSKPSIINIKRTNYLKIIFLRYFVSDLLCGTLCDQMFKAIYRGKLNIFNLFQIKLRHLRLFHLQVCNQRERSVY